MTTLKRNKLNQLLSNWPNGTVATSSWLRTQGFSTSLLSQYRKNSWITSLGRGADNRSKEKVEWTGGLYAIQEQVGLPIHVGGKTALQLQGYAHTLPLGEHMTVWLFGPPGIKLPAWFSEFDWGVNIKQSMTKLFPQNTNFGLTKKELGAYAIGISAPERAIMEVLHMVPLSESYEEAKLLMEGLATLRFSEVQKLLETCHSIKVKRLFLHLADECNLPWLKKLNLAKADLGKGKRVLVKGGYFDSKYGISVPGNRPPSAMASD